MRTKVRTLTISQAAVAMTVAAAVHGPQPQARGGAGIWEEARSEWVGGGACAAGARSGGALGRSAAGAARRGPGLRRSRRRRPGLESVEQRQRQAPLPVTGFSHRFGINSYKR